MHFVFYKGTIFSQPFPFNSYFYSVKYRLCCVEIKATRTEAELWVQLKQCSRLYLFIGLNRDIVVLYFLRCESANDKRSFAVKFKSWSKAGLSFAF